MNNQKKILLILLVVLVAILAYIKFRPAIKKRQSTTFKLDTSKIDPEVKKLLGIA